MSMRSWAIDHPVDRLSTDRARQELQIRFAEIVCMNQRPAISQEEFPPRINNRLPIARPSTNAIEKLPKPPLPRREELPFIGHLQPVRRARPAILA